MYIVKPIVIECKKCLNLMEITDMDLVVVASYERSMGTENEYQDEQDIYCSKCGAQIDMRILVSEYPEDSVNYVSIEADNASVVENPVFSCYDDFTN